MHKSKLRTHKGTSTRRQCEELGKELGVSVSGCNPGDGTKVRVHEGVGKDWFDSHAIEGYGYGYGLAATQPLTSDTAEDTIE